MDKNNTRTLVKRAALAMVLAALVLMEERTVPVCNIDTTSLEKCRPAVTGNNPPPPGNKCCRVLQVANLECICSFKSYLPVLATTNPSKLEALLTKCGVTTIPPACLGKIKVP
ncbi:unnamed protein product [Thlaspi arvense]|uniref:Bifunctional inhibitor/plant lipid transfer protein/seed storage helical domain-containing protein n=1 Tax=Thlaspi arvense TaxID=13288 RepID=A0AAU9SQH1_THLAR|nr:unnamed protein product [Thlaspi arvense]